jgi:hypothetical protein|tara:strand:+ start:3260 stop:3493 length:234 start_codon:yes stop_codon:yes gene_type:complete
MEDISERLERLARDAAKKHNVDGKSLDIILALMERIREMGKVNEEELEKEFKAIGEAEERAWLEIHQPDSPVLRKGD